MDVRAPTEFAKGAIAGAVNIPLFSNLERADIGTIYKHRGREDAIRQGLAFIGPRLEAFAEAFAPYRERNLVVYCARGGMRSNAVVTFLGALGFRVQQLPGGYKAYRNHLPAALERRVPPRLVVIHGQTGVGKTALLGELPNALDLEGLARHRSSLFGGVNLKPRTQQHFEAHLLRALEGLDPARPVWVEGESRKVGQVVLPEGLRRAMRDATCVLVTASVPTRVRRIIAEYGGGRDAATLEQLVAALERLRGFFGAEETARLAALVRAGELAPVVETLLLRYYDPRYRHAMRHYRYALEVSSEDLPAAAAELRRFGAQVAAGTAAPPGAGPAGARRRAGAVS